METFEHLSKLAQEVGELKSKLEHAELGRTTAESKLADIDGFVEGIGRISFTTAMGKKIDWDTPNGLDLAEAIDVSNDDEEEESDPYRRYGVSRRTFL